MNNTILFFLTILTGAVSSCSSHALTIEKSRDYPRKIDISVKEEIHDYVCRRIDCYAPLHVDEFKVQGTQFAALRVSLHYYF